MNRLSAILSLLGYALAAVGVPASASDHGEPIKPVPLLVESQPKKAALGEALFRDVRLSHDNSISCASCHDLSKGGADHRPLSLGIHDRKGELNAPSVFNSSLNFKQFWDGRAATLEDQIEEPVYNANEMGSNWDEVSTKLRAEKGYVSAFAAIYPDGIQVKNIKDAIAHFERTLLTPNSRFDQFLRGNITLLTETEQEGYRKFKELGCSSCHQGVNVGGNMFEALGTMADYFGSRGGVTKADYGRFNITGREADRYVFKVPSLRNVTQTAPYFHDGSVTSLEEAVSLMAKYQLGESLPPREVSELVAFLGTLTGEYGGKQK